VLITWKNREISRSSLLGTYLAAIERYHEITKEVLAKSLTLGCVSLTWWKSFCL
jgi:hypothetical protein